MYMDDFPGNSHERKSATATNPENDGSAKKVERVTTGVAKKNKPTLTRKFLDVFVGGDAKNVLEYIFVDVLVPALKDALVEAATQGIERTLFGESRGGRRSSYRPTQSSYTNYGRYQTSQVQPPRREDPRRIASRRSHEYEDLILPTRTDADGVLERMYDMLEKFERVTVSDLYDMTGVPTNYLNEKWGWYVLDGSRVKRVPSGYLLDLPRPEPLN